MKEVHSEWDNETINDTAIKYCKNPDVDGDNITDGKEINGYDVKIITGWKSDGTPISEMVNITPDELDPLVPYGYTETVTRNGEEVNITVYTDSDNDGIPDVVESWFSNVSIVKSASYRNAFKQKFGSELYNEYSWVINYFWTIYDKDYDEHHNSSSAMQNATQWLRDQFNPLVRDRTPPVITKFKLSWDVETSWLPPWVSVYAVVHIAIRDVGGITSFTIYDKDSGETYTPGNLGETSYDIAHKFSVSVFTATFGSVKIKVYARDYAGNAISVEKELKGALESVIDALAKLWDAIWNTLAAVGRAVASAVNVIVQWIIGFIKDAFNKFVTVLQNIANGYNGEILDVMYGRKNIASTTLIRDAEIFGYGIIGLIMGLGIFAAVFSGGFSSATSLMSKVIGEGFINEMLPYIGKKFIAAFLIGAIVRLFEQWIFETENLDESQKEFYSTIGDLIVAGIGGVITGIIGDRDLINLIVGYIIFMFGLTATYWVKSYGEKHGWTVETINTIIFGVQSLLLTILLAMTIKSILTFTFSDAIGGVFGWIDEFILGFLFTSSLITFRETIWNLLLKALSALPTSRQSI